MKFYKPSNIPASPRYSYKEKGWTSVGDFLGTGFVACSKVKRPTYEEAQSYAISLKLTGANHWKRLYKLGKIPKNFPSAPDVFYKDSGWESWGIFLGTGNVNTKNKKYWSKNESTTFLKPLNIPGIKGWRKYCKSGNKPDEIPSTPEKVYKDNWNGIRDFLGTNI